MPEYPRTPRSDVGEVLHAVLLLSAHGSDRATAYNMSNKIVRRDGDLFVSWLEAPIAPGAPTRIMLGRCDATTGALCSAFPLGTGIDNHCGAALALDAGGRMHAVIGAHHGPFTYRWSERPKEPAAWSAPEPLGPADTYPSLAVDAKGTLHLAHRERADRWQLWYRRKPAGKTWTLPTPLATSPTPGYSHYMQSLTVGPSDTVHLTLQYHYAASGRAEECQGRAAVYLWSEDGGDTWFNEGTRCDSLPITIQTMRPICHYPDGGVRIGNHVVDAQNRPWLYASLPGSRGGVLWHRDDTGWGKIDLSAALGGLCMQGGRATSLSRDASGCLYLVVAVNPDGRNTPWFDPSLELFHLSLAPDGAIQRLRQVTLTDPSSAHWLPAVEQWDWNRRETCCRDGPWMLSTGGLNAGGIHGDNRNAVNTDVYLTRI